VALVESIVKPITELSRVNKSLNYPILPLPGAYFRLFSFMATKSTEIITNDGSNGGRATAIAYRKLSIDGYSSNVFAGKMVQMKEVANFIKTRGFLPPELIETEVAWFYK